MTTFTRMFFCIMKLYIFKTASPVKLWGSRNNIEIYGGIFKNLLHNVSIRNVVKQASLYSVDSKLFNPDP